MIRVINSWIEKGHINALRALCFLAHQSTQSLGDWAIRYPEYVKTIAQNQSSWPIICSRSNSKNKETLKILEAIGLETNDPARPCILRSDPSAATKWATELFRQIYLAKDIYLQRKSKRLLHIRQLPYSDKGYCYLHLKYPEIAEAAEKLPDLNDGTLKDWWDVAHRLFTKITNNEPWKNPDLSGYTANANYKTDGSKRDAVLKKIRQAFEVLAKGTLQNTLDH